jgi:hypothetical protein
MGKRRDPTSNTTRAKQNGGVAQEEEDLPSKHKVLTSNPSTAYIYIYIYIYMQKRTEANKKNFAHARGTQSSWQPLLIKLFLLMGSELQRAPWTCSRVSSSGDFFICFSLIY